MGQKQFTQVHELIKEREDFRNFHSLLAKNFPLADTHYEIIRHYRALMVWTYGQILALDKQLGQEKDEKGTDEITLVPYKTARYCTVCGHEMIAPSYISGHGSSAWACPVCD